MCGGGMQGGSSGGMGAGYGSSFGSMANSAGGSMGNMANQTPQSTTTQMTPFGGMNFMDPYSMNSMYQPYMGNPFSYGMPYMPSMGGFSGQEGGSMGNMSNQTIDTSPPPMTPLGQLQRFSQQPAQPAQPAPQPLNADQQFLQGFNKNMGTNYGAMTQIPANDYTSYMQRSGQSIPQATQPDPGKVAQQPMPAQTTQGPYAQFPPPKYPTWLYGPTASLFGGVTRPNNVPMNYGYFPGSQTWGTQPSGGF